MITYFDSNDMLLFADFILSDARREMQKKQLEVGSLQHRLKHPNNLDLQAFMAIMGERAAKKSEKPAIDLSVK